MKADSDLGLFLREPFSEAESLRTLSAKPTNASVLTLRGGSSSINFLLFAVNEIPQRVLAGSPQRIGLPHATFVVKDLDHVDNSTRSVTAADDGAAVGSWPRPGKDREED